MQPTPGGYPPPAQPYGGGGSMPPYGGGYPPYGGGYGLPGVGDDKRCPFYDKMGACRHGDRCTKVHIKPTTSPTLLLPLLYPNPRVVPVRMQKGDQVVEAEYDRKWLKKHQQDFYEDLFLTLMEFGPIEEMCVLDNVGEHLLGNIYVRFDSDVTAQNALDGLREKMFNGILLLPELSPVTDFGEALCKEEREHDCKRGLMCNFWHPNEYPRRDSRLMYDLEKDQAKRWRKVATKRQRTPSPDRDGRGRGMLCHICGEYGHISRECHLKGE